MPEREDLNSRRTVEVIDVVPGSCEVDATHELSLARRDKHADLRSLQQQFKCRPQLLFKSCRRFVAILEPPLLCFCYLAASPLRDQKRPEVVIAHHERAFRATRREDLRRSDTP